MVINEYKLDVLSFLKSQKNLTIIYCNKASVVDNKWLRTIRHDHFALLYDNNDKTIKVFLLETHNMEMSSNDYSKHFHTVKTGADLLNLKKYCEPNNNVCLANLEVFATVFKNDNILSTLKIIKSMLVTMSKYPKTINMYDTHLAARYSYKRTNETVQLMHIENDVIHIPCMKTMDYRSSYYPDLSVGYTLENDVEKPITYSTIRFSDPVFTIENINVLIMFPHMLKQYNQNYFKKCQLFTKALIANTYEKIVNWRPFHFLASKST